MMTMLDAARSAYAAGLCVLPVRADGSKLPAVGRWGRYKTVRPTEEEMTAWAFQDAAGIGMVAGAVSGYRECWDFDDAEVYDLFGEAALACGLGVVIARIRQGYEDATPRGGRRWIVEYPKTVTWKDATLARRPGGGGRVHTLIELPTWAILAPSRSRVHPTGRPYRRLGGDFETIAYYAADEREALVGLARSFNQMPVRQPSIPRRGADGGPGGQRRCRPGDLYNQRATWADVLEPLGWTAQCELNDVTYWTRPGKTWGTSATTNYYGQDRLYVFSSSTIFDPEQSYTKFGAYATAYHGGDFEKAALALARMGFEEEEP